MKNLFPLSLLIFFIACLDPPAAWKKYPVTDQLEKLANLPKSIDESSGLLYWQKGLWTVNDGGDGAKLYQVGIHQKQKIREIKIKGIKNIDWESISQDSSFFYIGDFGNNDGIRQDLSIHLVDKTALASLDDKIPNSGTIRFSYADQKVILPLPQKNHNFDCEAMVVAGDSIYLFSKNHFDQRCNLYRFPKTPGEASAIRIGTFPVDGKITGASLTEDGKLLVLLGYNHGSGIHRPFLWLFYDFPGHQFFSGKHQRINLSVSLQMEGIAHFGGTQFLLTNEMAHGEKGMVHLIDVGEWVKFH